MATMVANPRRRSEALRTVKEKLAVLQGMSDEIGSKMVIETAIDAVESTMEAALC